MGFILQASNCYLMLFKNAQLDLFWGKNWHRERTGDFTTSQKFPVFSSPNAIRKTVESEKHSLKRKSAPEELHSEKELRYQRKLFLQRVKFKQNLRKICQEKSQPTKTEIKVGSGKG